MAKQTINIGTVANDGTGDSPRAGASKINANFDEIYATGIVDNKRAGRITVTEVTSSYTFQTADVGSILEFNSGSAIALTLPHDDTDNVPTGSIADALQIGSGLLSVIGEFGVRVNDVLESGSLQSQVDCQGFFKSLSIYKKDSNDWRVIGGT